METACSFDKWVPTYKFTRRFNPEDQHLHRYLFIYEFIYFRFWTEPDRKTKTEPERTILSQLNFNPTFKMNDIEIVNRDQWLPKNQFKPVHNFSEAINLTLWP
jgi:hypothetical protein